MKRASLLLAAVVLAGPWHIGTASASCGVDPEDPPVSVDAPVLAISASTDKATYKPKERVRVTVAVRLAQSTGPKVEGAQVKVEVRDGLKVLRTLHGETDGSGDVAVSLPMPSALRSGKLTARVTAEREALPSYDCRRGLVYEHADLDVDPLARLS